MFNKNIAKDDFINIHFESKTLDIYYVRRSIFQAIQQIVVSFKGNFLDFGCGKMPYKKFIISNSTVHTYTGIDLEVSLQYDSIIKPDIFWDGKKMPLDNNSFETVMATEVLEHCNKPEVTLNEIYRVLTENGLFFFTVPYLWTLHEVPHDEFRYTPFSMKRLLEEAGFKSIEIKSLGGWNASLAQMLGLWVRRSPLSAKKRRWLSVILKPIIKYLIKNDIIKNNFYEGQMITGLYGTARK